ncbi:MAG TPA: amidase family protein [Gaiellales bacterium]|jgi:amidase|nr:amidase family protein [Gaiellales bacterium]
MRDELCLLPATEQAHALREGACSARELVEAHLERIERIDPLVNAIVTRTPEHALAAADEADRRRARGDDLPPLHGLPIAHKDLQDTAGVRTTYGSPSYRDHVPGADSLQVERLREAGAILVGKTNTPEWGAGSHTFNTVFGATRNAWDTTRSAGGSSGGGAVALACRMLPIADGSDLGGSLRNPAAWSGVFGLRPTPGLVPHWPVSAPWLPFAVEGPMARTTGDLALLLRAMAGPDARDPLSQRAARGDLAPPFAAVSGRRVAWSPTVGGLPVDAATSEVLAASLPLLREAGLDVHEDEPDLSGADEVFETWRAFLSATGLGEEYDKRGDAMKATVRAEVERGRALTSAMLSRATSLQAGIAERVRAFFDRYDYLACPVTQVEPFPVEHEYATEIDGVPMSSYIEWMRSNSRISTTLCPAISVPVGFTSAGLPVGLQLVTRAFGERALLEVAFALEQRSGLGDRLPPVAL